MSFDPKNNAADQKLVNTYFILFFVFIILFIVSIISTVVPSQEYMNVAFVFTLIFFIGNVMFLFKRMELKEYKSSIKDNTRLIVFAFLFPVAFFYSSHGVPVLISASMKEELYKEMTVSDKFQGIKHCRGYLIELSDIPHWWLNKLCINKEQASSIRIGDSIQIYGKMSWIGYKIERYIVMHNNG